MKKQDISADYLMESVNENNRLKNKIKPDKFVRLYLNQFIKPYTKVLDVGCGPAVIDEYIAQTYPHTHITGLDISANRLIQAKEMIQHLPNLLLVSANVYYLPFNDNTFDVIFSRMLFEYLKYPNNALEEIKRVCKPGGYVIVQDIDGQFYSLYPEDNILISKMDQIFKAIKKHSGFDPFVGRKLYHLFHTLGFNQIQVQIEPYHLIAGKINAKNDLYWKEKLISALPQLSKQTKKDTKELLKVIELYLDYLRREDTMSFSNLFTVYGIK